MRGDERHSTTILSVRHKGVVAIGGDGQVTIGGTVVKHNARKIRRLYENRVAVGFAGSTADAFALLERFEAKLKDFQGNMPKAATELAKEWRTDRVLRRLECLMAAVDKEHSLLLSGSGDVIVPDDGIIGIGSGGAVATAAARALVRHSTLDAPAIVEEALHIAAALCIYTNDQVYVETVT
ncbi:MAG TPA: ATP-dependent protease subunit HslV [Planctomycetota bacterium]|nr:ATP-dependent protease subunit HslV [Planctomycetota bacterium]